MNQQLPTRNQRRVAYCAVAALVLLILTVATGELSLFVAACVAGALGIFFEVADDEESCDGIS